MSAEYTDPTSAEYIKVTIDCWESSERLKIEGNDAMRAGRFSDALKKQVLQSPVMKTRSFLSRYDLALLSGPTERELEGMRLNRSSANLEPQCASMEEGLRLIRLNRSLANLKLQRYEEALEDADHHQPGARSEKQLYRASLALYHLDRLQESSDMLEGLVRQFPGNTPAARQLSLVKQRLREKMHGQYDYMAMYAAAKNNLEPPDFASYSRPVAVKKTGDGLITTRAVRAGELLVCEKAFFLYSDNDTMKTFASKLLEKLQHRPALIPPFISLDKTQPMERHADGSPSIDALSVQRIVATNTFNSHSSTLRAKGDEFERRPIARRLSSGNYGIWLLAPHMNHSCLNNVSLSWIGQMMIIRATCDLPANTEIKFWCSELDFRARKPVRLPRWGVDCTCPICVQNMATPKKVFKKRASLVKGLEAASGNKDEPNIPETERQLEALEHTYSVPATQVPRLELCGLYTLYAYWHSNCGRPEKTMFMALKFFVSLGFVFEGLTIPSTAEAVAETTSDQSPHFAVQRWGISIDSVLDGWYFLWQACSIVKPHLCDDIEVCARISYKIIMGEDETFREEGKTFWTEFRKRWINIRDGSVWVAREAEV